MPFLLKVLPSLSYTSLILKGFLIYILVKDVFDHLGSIWKYILFSQYLEKIRVFFVRIDL